MAKIGLETLTLDQLDAVSGGIDGESQEVRHNAEMTGLMGPAPPTTMVEAWNNLCYAAGAHGAYI